MKAELINRTCERCGHSRSWLKLWKEGLEQRYRCAKCRHVKIVSLEKK